MGWIIFGVIMLILIIILFSPVKVYVSFFEKKPKVVLKYLFIRKTLSGDEKKQDKPEKEKRKKDKKNKSEDSSDESEKKKKGGLLPDSLSGKIEFIKSIASTGGKAFRRLTKHIKIKDIYIDIQVSDPDACECALKFGKMNIIVFNTISYLGNFVRLKKKSINIKCVYNQPECIYNVSFNVRLTPAAAIIIVVAFICRFLVNTIKIKRKYSNQQTVE